MEKMKTASCTIPLWTLAIAGLAAAAGCTSQPELRAASSAPTVNLVTINDQVLLTPDAGLSLSAVEGVGGDEEVCRRVEVTGTRFPQTVCKPASEWNDLRRRQRADGQEFIRQTMENAATVNRNTTGPTPEGARLY